MKVICIENSNLKEGKKPLLTINKLYEMIIEDDYCYTVIDNTGIERPYHKSRFKKLRDENLKKLDL